MHETTGLTLGKYAPFHAGHQLVVETALREMDRVIVVIYDCPETTAVPLPVRARWIRELYPAVEVLEAWDGPTEVGATPAIERRHEAYMLRLLGGRRVTHFYSSEFYGAHMSRALGAVDRRVDPERGRVPISATLIRARPAAYRHFLAPRVYRDLVAHVGLLGAPGSGRAALAARLAQRAGTVWLPELDLARQDHVGTPAELLRAAEEQLQREDDLLAAAAALLFTVGNALATAQIALHTHGHAPPQLLELADKCAARYDLVLVCDAGDAEGEAAAWRRVVQKRIVADLQQRRIPHLVLRGDLAARQAHAEQLLGRFEKYRSLLDSAPPR